MPAGIGYRRKARGRGRGMKRLPSGSLPRSGPVLAGKPKMGERKMLGKERKGRGRVSSGAQAGLGRQLSRRVKSGAITQEQAQKTAGERKTFREAFGKDWRTKVSGDRGYVQRTRLAAAKDPSNPRLAALNKKLMERRSRMLKAARKKTGEGEEAQKTAGEQ